MNQSITPTTKHFSPAASLAAIGVKLSPNVGSSALLVLIDCIDPPGNQRRTELKDISSTTLSIMHEVMEGVFAGQLSFIAVSC